MYLPKERLFYFFTTSTIVFKFYFDGCFFLQFICQLCSSVSYLSLIYMLFFNKEPLYKELEAEI